MSKKALEVKIQIQKLIDCEKSMYMGVAKAKAKEIILVMVIPF